jgi:DNA-binding MarR family transcriptional regulator
VKAKQPASTARDLSVVLYDLAWLLPRTIGVDAARKDPLPASELEVMRLLARRPGLSVTDVARELGLQQSNVSTAVRGLVDRGLLARRADGEDKRVVRLEPTTEALQARDRRERAWGQALGHAVSEWPPAQAQELLDAVPLLQRLVAQLAIESGDRDRSADQGGPSTRR